MGGFSGGGDDDAEAVVLGGGGEFFDERGGAVCAEDVSLKRNPELFQLIEAFLNNGQIAVAAHDNGDFFHISAVPFVFHLFEV